jgi:hypothetical protein
MASVAFPKIPAKAWRELRTRAASAPSTKFTANTVAALLNMGSPRSASDNIVSPMRKVGLIEEDGTLTGRGHKWRVDATYAEACQEILDEVYPSELTALTDDAGQPDKARVLTWMQHRGYGDSNARQMATTYDMIAAKSIPEAPNDASRPQRGRDSRTPPKKVARQASKAKDPVAISQDQRDAGGDKTTNGPDIHLDIQIHIPANATPEQIDQIFASMARHLYQR